MPRLLIAVLVAVLGVSVTFASNWPRFRGENGRGISHDKGVPVKFDGKKPLWSVDLPGVGNASPVVWEGKVVVQTSTEDGSERKLVCLSLADGKILWTVDFPGDTAKTHGKNSLASGTAATDGQRIFAPIWNGKDLSLVAYDFNGKEVWTHTFPMFKSQHGAGHSPIVVKDKVVLFDDQDGRSSIVALDAVSGKVVWEKMRPASRTCYSTPILIEHPGVGEAILAVSTPQFAAYHPDTGDELWHWDWSGNGLRTVGSPVAGDGVVVVGSGNGAGNRHAVAIRTGGSGDVSANGLAWEEKRTLPYVPSMLVAGDNLFFVNDGGLAGCYNIKTGEEVWKKVERLGGNFFASPVLIDGKIYAVNEKGEIFVYEAASEFHLLHKTAVDDTVIASPAVADGRLLIRGRTKLFCFGQ